MLNRSMISQAVSAMQGGQQGGDQREALKQQILDQWKQIGVPSIGGGMSIEDRAAGLADRLYANQIYDLNRLKLEDNAKTQVASYSPVQVRYDENGNPQYGFYSGDEYGQSFTPLTPEQAATVIRQADPEGGSSFAYQTGLRDRAADEIQKRLNYDGRQIGFLGNIGDGGRNADPSGYLQRGGLASWSALGEGAVSYTAQQGPDGKVYFVPSWGSTSDRGLIAPLASIGLGLLAPGLGSAIGSSLGASGAAASALGGAVLGGGVSAATGGDILKGAALGGLGGYASGALGGSAPVTNTTGLTPAAIEAGLGTPGYGFNAAAASSGLFNPSLIGAGAALNFDAPATMPTAIPAAAPAAPAAAPAASPTNLTPAAMEAGLGTPGYGYNASAAASELFDPSTIGAGAGLSYGVPAAAAAAPSAAPSTASQLASGLRLASAAGSLAAGLGAANTSIPSGGNMDYMALADKTAANNLAMAKYTTAANRVNQTNQFGTQNWVYTPQYDANGNETGGGWTQTTTLNPEQQALFNSQTAGNQGVSDAANAALRNSAQLTNPNLDLSRLPGYQGIDASRLRSVNDLNLSGLTNINGINLNALPRGAINPGTTAQQAIMSRLQPQLSQYDNELSQRLANQGITLGSEAYNREMALAGQRRNDLELQAAAQGISLDQAARQQAFGEQQGLFNSQFAQRGQGLTEQQALYNSQMGQRQQGLAEQQAIDSQIRQQRGQMLNEQQAAINVPLNTINALRSGSQVQNPTFGNFAQQANVAGADALGAANQQYTNQLNAANAQRATNAGMFGGLAQLGTAALLAPKGTFSSFFPGS